MGQPSTPTVTISQDTKHKLETLAKETNRSESALVEQAISTYLGIEAWQIEKIKRSIAYADANLGKGIPHGLV
jgi:predicted transcriptional regulator